MNTKVIRDFFQRIFHKSSVNSVPESLRKNTHIPCLGFKIIMSKGRKYSKNQHIKYY